MATFMMAMNIVADAKKAHTDFSHQLDLSLDSFKTEGVRELKVFALMGRYDLMATFDADDQTTAFRVASLINSMGILQTETWPVIPFEEFSSMLGS